MSSESIQKMAGLQKFTNPAIVSPLPLVKSGIADKNKGEKHLDFAAQLKQQSMMLNSQDLLQIIASQGDMQSVQGNADILLHNLQASAVPPVPQAVIKALPFLMYAHDFGALLRRIAVHDTALMQRISGFFSKARQQANPSDKQHAIHLFDLSNDKDSLYGILCDILDLSADAPPAAAEARRLVEIMESRVYINLCALQAGAGILWYFIPVYNQQEEQIPDILPFSVQHRGDEAGNRAEHFSFTLELHALGMLGVSGILGNKRLSFRIFAAQTAASLLSAHQKELVDNLRAKRFTVASCAIHPLSAWHASIAFTPSVQAGSGRISAKV
jgi:hypothetical protein